MNLHVGIIGCGQLGQMLGRAALRLNLRVSYLSLEEAPVVTGLGDVFSVEQVDDFLAHCDVITVEREAVPQQILVKADQLGKLRPSLYALEQLRNRDRQKTSLDELGIPTAPWKYIANRQALAANVAELEAPYARCKQALGGYDGGGQWRVAKGAPPEIAERCFPLIMEREVDIEAELSLLIARDETGDVVCYPPVENHMRQGVLVWSYAPAPIADELVQQMQQHAIRLADAVEYVGVLAVEYFISGGKLLVNEVAPRVHNTGHWTIDASSCDQFDQHIRAVAGLALIPPLQYGAVAMGNILGERLPADLPDAAVRLYVHTYGKSFRPGRKLGHLTLVAPTLAQARAAAERVEAQRLHDSCP